MRYNFKITKIPDDMVVGSTVYVSGEGDDEFTVTDILRDGRGSVTEVCISSGWREPLSKIWLCKPGQDFYASHADPSNWIQVAVGECDTCKQTFPDSCIYHKDPTIEGSMICQKCWNKNPVHKGQTCVQT